MVTSCSPRPMRVVQRASNCVGCQEGWAISAGHEPRHGELFLTMAFRIVSSLRMQATKATFFVLPAASVPGAEEDGAVHVGLRHQVPAEGHGGRVGTRMDYGRQLVPDAVSSHRRHGEVSGRAGRWQQWICGLLTGMATGVSRRVISGHESCAIKPPVGRRPDDVCSPGQRPMGDVADIARGHRFVADAPLRRHGFGMLDGVHRPAAKLPSGCAVAHPRRDPGAAEIHAADPRRTDVHPGQLRSARSRTGHPVGGDPGGDRHRLRRWRLPDQPRY